MQPSQGAWSEFPSSGSSKTPLYRVKILQPLQFPNDNSHKQALARAYQPGRYVVIDFDYVRYLLLLEPLRIPAPPPPGPDDPLAEWVWPLLRPYNGFRGERRLRVWQLHRFAFDAGTLARPEICAVCDSLAHVGFHSENYADPWTPIPLCHACHTTVHGRFRFPDAWPRFQARHHRPGVVQWFDLLPATPIDLAGWLRRSGGE